MEEALLILSCGCEDESRNGGFDLGSILTPACRAGNGVSTNGIGVGKDQIVYQGPGKLGCRQQ